MTKRKVVIRANEELFYPLVKHGKYQIDEHGRVWRTFKSKPPVRAEKIKQSGTNQIDVLYLQHAPGKPTNVNCSAHRLVWLHFKGPIPDDKVIYHKNGDKTDNRLTNLIIGTFGESAKHGWKLKRAA